MSLFHQCCFVEAKNYALLLTNKFPQDKLSWMLLGMSFVQLGLNAEALAPIQKVISLSPVEADAHNILGVVFFNLGQMKEAQASYRRALQINPNYVEAHSNLGNTLKALGFLAEAEACYCRALQLKPDYAMAHFNLGITLKSLGRLVDAETSYLRALKIKPDYAEAYGNLGLTLQDMGRFDEAEAAYLCALRINPKLAEVLSSFASLLFYQGRFNEAEQCCLNALQIKPDFAEVHSIMGSVCHNQGRLNDAELHCRQAVLFNPDYAEAYGNLGRTLRKMGRLDEALTCYQRQFVLDPGNATTQHHIASLSGENTARAPDQYVEALFDSYADRFDIHLLQALKYESPQRLAELVTKYLPTPTEKWDVLDLGCGTGLVGPEIAPFTRSLVGVDLSNKMLQKARERNLYNRLEHLDLLTMMRGEATASYDVVFAADVFVYLGELDEIICEIRRLLRPTGVIAFSVESLEQSFTESSKNEEQKYRLEQTGRYTHSKNYLHQLAASNGFYAKEMITTPIRTQHGKQVHGHLVLFTSSMD